MIRLLVILMGCILFLAGCEYKKGNIYRSNMDGDTLQYIIASKGLGVTLIEKAHQMKEEYEKRGDTCRIYYVTDSVNLGKEKTILLSRSVLPNIQEDMLSKGYFGTFTSKQDVTILLVSRNEFEKYFIKVK